MVTTPQLSIYDPLRAEKFAPDLYIRLNDEKVLDWLKSKVQSVLVAAHQSPAPQVQAVAAHLVAKAGEATVSSFNDAEFSHNQPKETAPPVVTDG